eukprot:Blabericola_migrator_1__5739@NODE_290_length_10281_cov_162_780693_g238_i0_p3_GENE_NODE_290_length_10281_cov_162_780693_g238_i0NODE_290_length_10281_cov_162_780693_g238_i0_p3_ORF_typecomplete_len377_score79_37zfCCCH_3/PF15663_5/0_4_NODE_290_length_10281_cov_162_780693_g238_i01441274
MSDTPPESALIASDVKSLLNAWSLCWQINIILKESFADPQFTQVAYTILMEDRWDRDVCPSWLTHPTHTLLTSPRLLDDLPPFHTFPISSQRVWTTVYPYQDCVTRRDPFLYFYLPVLCARGAVCSNAFCPLSHSSFERMFHPLVYRSSRCDHLDDDGNCRVQRCAFSHSLEDKRPAENWWILWEHQWHGWRSHVDAITKFCSMTTGHQVPLVSEMVRYRLGDTTQERRVSHEVKLQRLSTAAATQIQKSTGVAVGPYPSRFQTHIARQILNPLHLVLLDNQIEQTCLQTISLMKVTGVDDMKLTWQLISHCWARILGGFHFLKDLQECRQPPTPNAVCVAACLLCSLRAVSEFPDLFPEFVKTTRPSEPTKERTI